MGKFLLLARVSGVDWAVAQTLTDQQIEARLLKPPVPRAGYQLMPDFALIHQELKRLGVTLQLLWEEYQQGSEQAYRYTSVMIFMRPTLRLRCNGFGTSTAPCSMKNVGTILTFTKKS